MIICRVSQEELTNDRGDDEIEYVDSLDFAHDLEYRDLFREAIMADDAVLNQVIKVYTSKGIADSAKLIEMIGELIEKQVDGLEKE